MTTSKPMPFTLPAEPVDRFEAVVYEADGVFFEVRKRSFVYHINTAWTDLFPGDVRPDGRPSGVALVNEWQVLHDGRFTGRTGHGWAEAFASWDWSNLYSERTEAVAAVVKALQKSIARREDELTRQRIRLTELLAWGA